MIRLLGAALVALLLAASLAEGQRGWGRGFGRWGGEAGVPPRYATEGDQDGGFHFCRLQYTAVRAQQRGMGWGTDYPFADINFSIRLSEMTKTVVSKKGSDPNHIVVQPTDEWLSMCPFVMASDPGSAGFSAEDARGLRDYLLKGGFLWVDDFWGTPAWDQFRSQIERVLPASTYPIQDVPAGDPILRSQFQVASMPQITNIQFWRGVGGTTTSERGADTDEPHFRVIRDTHGRIIVVMTHNTDIADSWEREGEDPGFFYQFSPNGYAFGINVVLHAMTH
jgi:hypothetical protein